MINEPTVQQLKEGNNAIFTALYKEYKNSFVAFARGYGIANNDAVEVYQESIIALFENAATGKLVVLSSSVKTYIFSIGKYKILEFLRASQKTISANDIVLKEEVDDDINETIIYTKRQKLLAKHLNNLGKRCKNIIELFYLKGYKIDEIKEIEQYENANTVKAQKSRCLKQLKQLMNSPNS